MFLSKCWGTFNKGRDVARPAVALAAPTFSNKLDIIGTSTLSLILEPMMIKESAPKFQ